MRTLQVIYLEGKQRLQKAGNESPAFDAICLFEHVFHMNRQDLMLHGNTKQATLEQETEFFSLIEQRAKKRPLQYILGEWPFLDFHLKMGEGVLIAREDTTVLVETAAKLIQTKQATILDLCAGTGAVGLGIASLLSTAHVTCVEKYAPAFAYLQHNIALCKEQGIENVVALQGDILSEAFASAFQDIDTIVSNPPYIETAVLPTLQEEVQKEPTTALDGGEDGLLFYRAIADIWIPKIKTGGIVAVEIGEGQETAVARLFADAGVEQIQFEKDSGNIIRVVAGIKK